MRLSNVRQCHNKIREFKFQWHLARKRKVEFSGEKDYLEKMGIQVTPAKDILSEVVQTPKYQDIFPNPPPPPTPKETLHFIGPDYKPLLGQAMALAQNMTWSVVSDQLPQSVTDRQRELVTEDRQMVEQDILSSHLLDNWETYVKDPRNFELPNKLENINIYRIPMHRKNSLLTQSLVQTFDNTSLDPLASLTRPLLHDITAKCSFRYSGDLVQLALAVPLMVGSLSPLPPVVAPQDAHLFVSPELDEKTMRMVLRKQIKADTGGLLQQPLPDIKPLMPYIGAKDLQQYDDLPSCYVSSSDFLHPHTIHFHNNAELLHLQEHQLTSLSLLQLYAHALTYALHAGIKINECGHLETPVVVQGVHSHLNLFQPSVFQLNTIGPHCAPIVAGANIGHVTREAALAGANVRNVFFYRPFDELYEECKYIDAKPTLSGVNPELISILRALHEA